MYAGDSDGCKSTEHPSWSRALRELISFLFTLVANILQAIGRNLIDRLRKMISLVKIERGTKTRGSMDKFCQLDPCVSGLVRSQPNQQFVNCATAKSPLPSYPPTTLVPVHLPRAADCFSRTCLWFRWYRVRSSLRLNTNNGSWVLD